MKRMKAVEIRQPGGPLQLVERDIPSPAMGHVLIKVQACGICHSDVFTKDGLWPGIQYPRVPGHEIAGVIDAVGSGVGEWKPGQRVGVGWHGGHCGRCNPAAEVILSSVTMHSCRELAMTEATLRIWWFP